MLRQAASSTVGSRGGLPVRRPARRSRRRGPHGDPRRRSDWHGAGCGPVAAALRPPPGAFTGLGGPLGGSLPSVSDLAGIFAGGGSGAFAGAGGNPAAVEDVNPLDPCGACQEWLKKVAEVNPGFKARTRCPSHALRPTPACLAAEPKPYVRQPCVPAAPAASMRRLCRRRRRTAVC